MITEPVQQDARRRRRRTALLWFGSVTGVLLMLGLGIAGLGVLERGDRDEGARSVSGSSVSGSSVAGSGSGSAGSGSARVYDRLPDPARPTDAQDTGGSTPAPDAGTSDAGSGRSVPTNTSEQNASAADPDLGRPARPHGIDLVLSSTLDAPLMPGVRRALRVTVRNPNAFAVDLQRLDVRVGTPQAAGCEPHWVRVERFRASADGQRRIGGRTSTVVVLKIELTDLATVNQNACKGSAFPLTLSGIAVDAA